jgi:type II secretory pathway component PulF
MAPDDTVFKQDFVVPHFARQLDERGDAVAHVRSFFTPCSAGLQYYFSMLWSAVT